MALPENAAFEAFLDAAEIVSDRTEGPCISWGIPPAATATFASAVPSLPELYLRYSESRIQLQSVLTALRRSLEDVGHPADRTIALAMLGLIVGTRRPGTGAVAHANSCLSTVHSARLNQAVVLPSPYTWPNPVSLGPVTIKGFNPDHILYWARRGGSAYPVDLGQLRGHLSFQRAPVDVTLVTWEPLSLEGTFVKQWGLNVADICLIDVYYQAVFQYYFSQLPAVVKHALLLLEAGSLAYVDVDSFLRGPFRTVVGLFNWKSSTGARAWAILYRGTLWDASLSPSAVTDGETWLQEVLGFRALSSDKLLDRAIDSYARFLQSARDHRLNGRRDEAFLQSIIALDLIFGLETRSADSVSSRAAIVVYRQAGRSLEEQKKRIRKLYDSRSKYVHEGRASTPDEDQEADSLCIEILWALLATSARDQIRDIDEWLNCIDLIEASLRVGRTIPEEEFEHIGVPRHGVARRAPNRVEDIRSPAGLPPIGDKR